MKSRVVVTGMGVVAPNGNTIEEFWCACIAGQSGIDYVRSFDTSEFDVKIGGEVKGFDPSQYMLPAIFRKTDRYAHLGIAAAKMALDDSNLIIDKENQFRIGVIVGSGLGGAIFHEEQIINVIKNGGPSKIMASSVPRISPNSVSAYIAIASQAKGPNYVISTACSSGANAIGQALLFLRSGLLDVCIAGGVEAPLTPVTFAGYQSLHALSRRNCLPQLASCPFDINRDGFVMSEGAGFLILETLEHAEKRKAKIYAELAGYGANCGAYNMVAPQPDGLDAARAIKDALKDAEIGIERVDYINAHGTSTVYNDLAETKAIKEVFGERAGQIAVSSTKSINGHSIGAAGAIEAVVSVLSICHQAVHPTINLQTPDPECDLDYVADNFRQMKVDVVLSNSFGFGSNNAALVFKKV